MTDTTANLNMPFILPSQAQKHVTHNEALLKLDSLVHLTIVSQQSAPPEAPAESSTYLVAAAPTGAWAGKEGRVACWQDGHWSFCVPKSGWRAWFSSLSRLKVFDATAWREIPLPSTGRFDQLGIGASADASNRLAVSSPASLFNNAGAGHQIKVNKASTGDTASLLFQTNWTGHAEMGLAGSNDFAIKVNDGASWKAGLSISTKGHVSRPNQPTARAHRSGTGFTPGDGSESGFTTLGLNQGGFTLGTTLSGGGKRITVPASGLYLLALNVAILSSSGHTTKLFRNGTQLLFSLAGTAGGARMQAASGIFSLSSGDYLTLGHSGTAELETGNGKTELSLTML